MSEQRPILHRDDGERSYGSVVNESYPGSEGNIQNKQVFIKVYKRRWYILLAFGLMSGTQCLVWNTFGPITDVSERVFGWNDGDISLLTNWGPIAYVVGTFVFCWIMDDKGLRPACVIAAFLVAAGTGVRCITSHPKVATPLIHIGQFLNGLAGPIAMGAPPAISSEWFAPAQRTTATAIGVLIGQFGCGASFLIADEFKRATVCIPDIQDNISRATPRLIHIGQFLNGLAGPIAMGAPPAISSEWFAPAQRTTATAIGVLIGQFGCGASFLIVPFLVPVQKLNNNHGSEKNSSLIAKTDSAEDFLLPENMSNIINNATGDYDVAAERRSMMHMMYIEFGWSLFCFLLFLIYFPSKPPLPPSPTASIQRMELKAGLKKLARNWTFVLICLTYGLALGVLNCFNGVLDLNLKSHNISQTDAGYLGFYGFVGSIVSSLIVARFADIFSRHMKWLLLTLFILGGGCFVVLTLSLTGVVPDLKVIIFISYILGNVFMYASTPLFYETGCEVSYPVAEGLANLVLTLVNNIFGLIFLLIQMIPNIGTMWENWALLGSIFVCVPVLMLLKENYNRLTIDETSREVPVEVNIDGRHRD